VTEMNQTNPSKPSPSAQALFAAFDGRQQSNTSDDSSNDVSKLSINTKSTNIEQRLRQLGWRNRYSQDLWYPVALDLPHYQQKSAASLPSPILSPGNSSTLVDDKSSQATTFVVQQVQRGEVEGTYGTGATVWPAAIVLIKYIERSCWLQSNDVVVDLGSGTGVTSIAAAFLMTATNPTHQLQLSENNDLCNLSQHGRVICTDGEDSVVQLARDNIVGVTRADQDVQKANVPWGMGNDNELQNNDKTDSSLALRGCPITVSKYWWGSEPLMVEGMSTSEQLTPMRVSANRIIVADCVLPKLYPLEPLVAAIDDLLATESLTDYNKTKGSGKYRRPEALLSYEHRYYAPYHPRHKFIEICHNRNLVVDVIPPEEHDPMYSAPDDIELWRVYRNESKHHDTFEEQR
jgi:hypothetical protein